MTKKEFPVTISAQHQADKWREKENNNWGLLVDSIPIFR